MNEQKKRSVLNHISGGLDWKEAQRYGKSKWEVSGNVIHMRFCSNSNKDGCTYVYNINPNTLNAHFEVWICGNSSRYYFIPIPIIKQIYTDPEGFVDKQHQNMRVVHINTSTHKVNFSRTKNNEIDFNEYFCAVLNPIYWVDSGEEFISKEGKKTQVSVNSYERNPELRKKCIAHHGTSCCICGFSFETVYGDVAKDFIHVHHLNPLSEVGSEHDVDPVNDLRPVCPNCHAVLHIRNPAYNIEEVRKLLKWKWHTK